MNRIQCSSSVDDGRSIKVRSSPSLPPTEYNKRKVVTIVGIGSGSWHRRLVSCLVSNSYHEVYKNECRRNSSPPFMPGIMTKDKLTYHEDISRASSFVLTKGHEGMSALLNITIIIWILYSLPPTNSIYRGWPHALGVQEITHHCYSPFLGQTRPTRQDKRRRDGSANTTNCFLCVCASILIESSRLAIFFYTPTHLSFHRSSVRRPSSGWNIKWPRDGISIPLSAIDLHGSSSFPQGYDDGYY